MSPMYEIAIRELLNTGAYALNAVQKERQILSILNMLHDHHRLNCAQYANITNENYAVAKEQAVYKLSDIPFLAVRLFKLLEMKSVDEKEVFRVLNSSGTTGQQPAKIFLDKDTSAKQSKVLVKILQEVLGKKRRPMLVIDSPALLKNTKHFNARSAGIQGISLFGRDLTFALDEDMQINWDVVEIFQQKYQDQPVLIFGFTYIVWLQFVSLLEKAGKQFCFPRGTLLHSGGWKKLIQQKISNERFKDTVRSTLGIGECRNFYGMAEQVGSIFMECEHGVLHTSNFSDVVVRDPYDLSHCATGKEGIMQVLSVIPTSYPGHSILTEDLGVIHGIDDCPCGRRGKRFSVLGRLPKTEVRGCSDTFNP